MPRRSGVNVNGGERLAEALASHAPSRVLSSPRAQFRAMERTGRGREFLNNAGVSASTRTQLNWLTGETTPNAANSRAIQDAYDRWVGSNTARRAGSTRTGSTPIEIYPSRDGADQYGRPVKNISISDADLGRAIKAYNRGDIDELNDIWAGVVDTEIIDSPPAAAYYNVSHVAVGG